MERILPLPKVVRKALISQFCALDKTEIEAILNNPQNKHCLVQVYLGKRNGTIGNNNNSLLRNFPLYLEPMEQIGIETVPLAIAMGKVYATLHWGAAINGDDVEPEFQHRAIKLYLLDFGQCETVDLTQDPGVVYQAFKGAMVTGDNQRFIPHCSRSPALFATFRQGCIESGNNILSRKKLENKFNIKDFTQEYEEYAEDFV
ncbi:uncharacterized protein N7487_009113 [Penicillium crustosum]|uniref:uncharacterized protein n=1 Tax=Penicillium crustosum TaxID=36656 RepID=UPI0023921719|nr:uncharacterized protein N7487_009113 [Penicillium crustosum]KAJ5394810.1 hypothetical protein N7487_009113 [Penicillium crustosum]